MNEGAIIIGMDGERITYQQLLNHYKAMLDKVSQLELTIMAIGRQDAGPPISSVLSDEAYKKLLEKMLEDKKFIGDLLLKLNGL